MKLKNFLVALVSLVFVLSLSTFAQEEMTVEEWEQISSLITTNRQEVFPVALGFSRWKIRSWRTRN